MRNYLMFVAIAVAMAIPCFAQAYDFGTPIRVGGQVELGQVQQPIGIDPGQFHVACNVDPNGDCDGDGVLNATDNCVF